MKTLFFGRSFLVWVVVLTCFISSPVQVFAQDNDSKKAAVNFKSIETEILEVEELKDPIGAAIYTAKDLTSGETMRFFADPHLSLIQTGGQAVTPGDVSGGSKATIIYRAVPERDIPEIVFAMVSDSYSS